MVVDIGFADTESPCRRRPRHRVLRPRTRALLDTALRRSPLQFIYRRKAADSLAVLTYHQIDDVEGFANQLDQIKHNARFVSLGEVARALADGRTLPPRSVLLTFDDGDRSLVDRALPLLSERAIPAVAFVVAGLIDTHLPYWWAEVEYLLRHGGTAPQLPPCAPAKAVELLKAMPDQVRRTTIATLRDAAAAPPARQPQLLAEDLRRLEAAGVEIGNHTLSHPCLHRCDDATVRGEIETAHDVLHSALGRPPRAFAYPNGDWDPRAEAALDDLGYRLGFLFDHHLNPRLPANSLRMSRLSVSSDTSPNRFAITLSGLHPALHSARGGS